MTHPQTYPPYPQPKKPRIFLKVFLALMLVSILLIGGCLALLGGAANEVDKSLDEEQNAHAITKAQFKRAELGMGKKRLTKRLGEPMDKQSFESSGITEGESFKSSCVYYNRKGDDFGGMYQFCFDAGKLDSKNKW